MVLMGYSNFPNPLCVVKSFYTVETGGGLAALVCQESYLQSFTDKVRAALHTNKFSFMSTVITQAERGNEYMQN